MLETVFGEHSTAGRLVGGVLGDDNNIIEETIKYTLRCLPLERMLIMIYRGARCSRR